MKVVTCILKIASTLLMLCILVGSAYAVNYQARDLGVLPGFTSSEAWGINNKGQVVGYCTNSSGNMHAFLWDKGQMTDLGTLNNTWSWAEDINDAGTIVGTSAERVFDPVAGSWSYPKHGAIWQNSAISDAGTLGGQESWCKDINENGLIAGSAKNQSGQSRAVIWQDGSLRDLGIGGAFAINIHGDAVGEANSKAMVWNSSGAVNLGKLGGDYARAQDINDRGQVVAYSETYFSNPNTLRGYLWENGVVTELPTLGGLVTSPNAINNAGTIVGYCKTADNAGRAVAWCDGSIVQLPSLGGSGSGTALDINELGQIVGFGYSTSGYHAVLWEPVPEPASLSVLLCGLGGITCMLRRKQK